MKQGKQHIDIEQFREFLQQQGQELDKITDNLNKQTNKSLFYIVLSCILIFLGLSFINL